MGSLSAKNATSENDFKGNMPPEPGLYHVIITDAEDADESSKNFDKVTCQILAGDKEGQENRLLYATFFRDRDNGGFQDQHVRLAMATGYLQPGAEVSDFTVKNLKGGQCVVRVTNRQDKNDPDKHYTDIGNRGYDVWSLANPDVAGVPKNLQAMQQGGYAAAQQAMPQQAAVAPQGQPAQGQPVQGQPTQQGQPAQQRPNFAQGQQGAPQSQYTTF